MRLSARKMPGYTGGEGCQNCGFVNNGTRHYGQQIKGSEGEAFGFSGYRGPYCSAKCYRVHYPGDGENYVPPAGTPDVAVDTALVQNPDLQRFIRR